jgi:hypothetical protein
VPPGGLHIGSNIRADREGRSKGALTRPPRRRGGLHCPGARPAPARTIALDRRGLWWWRRVTNRPRDRMTPYVSWWASMRPVSLRPAVELSVGENAPIPPKDLVRPRRRSKAFVLERFSRARSRSSPRGRWLARRSPCRIPLRNCATSPPYSRSFRRSRWGHHPFPRDRAFSPREVLCAPVFLPRILSDPTGRSWTSRRTRSNRIHRCRSSAD